MALTPTDFESLEALVTEPRWVRTPSLALGAAASEHPLYLVTFTRPPAGQPEEVGYRPLAADADLTPKVADASYLLLRIAGDGWLWGPLDDQGTAAWLRALPTAFQDCELLVSTYSGS